MRNEETLPAPLSKQLRVGEQLKQLRQDKSLTLDEVAASTKISRSNLRAIESMEYDKLPADSFTKGQIVLYGSFLGMDGRLAADQFFNERDGGKKPFISSLQKSLNHQSLQPKKLAEPTHVSSAIIAGILLLLIVFSFTGFCLYFSWNPFAFLTDKTFNLSSSKNNIFHPADPATSNGSTHKQLKLNALFKKDSRVIVSLDNKQSFEQQYTQGTSAHWEAEKQLQLEFFQPDSAELQFNGAPLPFPDGAAGHYKLQVPPGRIRSMNLRSTCGIVLKISGHGEADKLVTLYCPDLGRVTGIAKGARKSKRRFVNKLEEFSHLHIFYQPPRGSTGLFLISEADLLAAHLSLRTDYQRYVSAMYLCELILRFTRDNDPDPRLYALMKWALSALDHEKSPQKIVTLAHLHLLDTAGYRPEFSRCHSCRQAVGPGRTYMFLPETGSLICSTCYPRQEGRSPCLSVQTLRLLANAQLFDLDRLHRLQFTQQSLSEAMDALHYFTLHTLQQDVHSWKILRPFVSGQNPSRIPRSISEGKLPAI